MKEPWLDSAPIRYGPTKPPNTPRVLNSALPDARALPCRTSESGLGLVR